MLRQDDVLGIIKSRGYWRILFRPTQYKKVFENNEQIKDFVRTNLADFTGWDFPHYPVGNDEVQQIDNGHEYIQALTLFGHHKEFWRMYQSGQFIYYLGFPEDWYEEHFWEDKRRALAFIKPMKNIGIAYNIMANIKCLFSFIFKFISKNNLDTSLLIDINLQNTKDRTLWSQDFSWEVKYRGIYPTSSNEIHVIREKVFSVDEILTENEQIQIDAIKIIFDSFGWNPAEEQIKHYLERLK